MDAKQFKDKWGMTQDEIAVLMNTNRSTISHWLSEGKHDASRAGTTSAQLSLDFWDLLLTAWLESDRRYAMQYEIFLKARERGKGEVFKEQTEEVQEEGVGDRAIKFARAVAKQGEIDPLQLAQLAQELGIDSTVLAKALNGGKNHANTL